MIARLVVFLLLILISRPFLWSGVNAGKFVAYFFQKYSPLRITTTSIRSLTATRFASAEARGLINANERRASHAVNGHTGATSRIFYQKLNRLRDAEDAQSAWKKLRLSEQGEDNSLPPQQMVAKQHHEEDEEEGEASGIPPTGTWTPRPPPPPAPPRYAPPCSFPLLRGRSSADDEDDHGDHGEDEEDGDHSRRNCLQEQEQQIVRRSFPCCSALNTSRPQSPLLGGSAVHGCSDWGSMHACGSSAREMTMIAGTTNLLARRRAPWSDEELAWIGNWLDEHPESQYELRRGGHRLYRECLNDIILDASVRAIFHPLHVIDSTRLRHGFRKLLSTPHYGGAAASNAAEGTLI